MKKILLFLIAFILGACSQVPSNTNSSKFDIDEVDSVTQVMKQNMPDDFDFSIQFGVGKKNEINNFEGTVTKDLIADGTTTSGETIKHFISGGYCEPTNGAKQLVKLRKYVFNIVKSKDEYKALPETKGAYQ